MSRGVGGGARLMSGLALAAFLIVQTSGCAVLGRPGPPGEDARRGVEKFLKATIARQSDRAFAWIEIESMVNYGQPLGPLYRTLSPQHQRQYRSDFVSGIYAFLFRDLPPQQALYRIDVPDPAQPAVEVTGRPGKRLRFTVRSTPAGMRIIGIEKAGGSAQ